MFGVTVRRFDRIVMLVRGAGSLRGPFGFGIEPPLRYDCASVMTHRVPQTILMDSSGPMFRSFLPPRKPRPTPGFEPFVIPSGRLIHRSPCGSVPADDRGHGNGGCPRVGDLDAA